VGEIDEGGEREQAEQSEQQLAGAQNRDARLARKQSALGPRYRA
jgi:hypothetical protein